ncbi:hypothetical protein V7R93_13915 [Klebsiella pneumoniae]
MVSFESTFGSVGEATLSVGKDTLIFTINNDMPFINANMSVPKVIFFKRAMQNITKKSYEECDNDETLIALCELSGAEKKWQCFAQIMKTNPGTYSKKWILVLLSLK